MILRFRHSQYVSGKSKSQEAAARTVVVRVAPKGRLWSRPGGISCITATTLIWLGAEMWGLPVSLWSEGLRDTWKDIREEERLESNKSVSSMTGRKLVKFLKVKLPDFLFPQDFSFPLLCYRSDTASHCFLLSNSFLTSLATPCHCWWLTHMSIRSLWKNLHFSGTRSTSLTNSPTVTANHTDQYAC